MVSCFNGLAAGGSPGLEKVSSSPGPNFLLTPKMAQKGKSMGRLTALSLALGIVIFAADLALPNATAGGNSEADFVSRSFITSEQDRSG